MAKLKAKPTTKAPPDLPAAALQLLEPRQIAAALRVSLRGFWRLVSAGEYPPADMTVGHLPRWRVATHNTWVSGKAEA